MKSAPYFNTAAQLTHDRAAQALVMRPLTADFAIVYRGHAEPKSPATTFAWAWLEYTRDVAGTWYLTNTAGQAVSA